MPGHGGRRSPKSGGSAWTSVHPVPRFARASRNRAPSSPACVAIYDSGGRPGIRARPTARTDQVSPSYGVPVRRRCWAASPSSPWHSSPVWPGSRPAPARHRGASGRAVRDRGRVCAAARRLPVRGDIARRGFPALRHLFGSLLACADHRRRGDGGTGRPHEVRQGRTQARRQGQALTRIPNAANAPSAAKVCRTLPAVRWLWTASW